MKTYAVQTPFYTELRSVATHARIYVLVATHGHRWDVYVEGDNEPTHRGLTYLQALKRCGA